MGDTVDRSRPPQPLATEQAVLEVRHVAKTFGGTRALVDANLRVRRGGIHALLGENGAGKSTLIKIIAGAVRPDAGRILIEGADVTLKNPRNALEQGIGVVYQELSLFPHLTVAENIVLAGARERQLGFNWDESLRRAEVALGRLGEAGSAIDPRALVEELRLDQRQLVEIARVLDEGAKVVILDEPTSALSHPEVEVLFGVIRTLAKEQGVGFVFVSHRLAEVRELCQRVTVLRNGATQISDQPLATVDDGTLVRTMAGSELADELSEARRREVEEAATGEEILRVGGPRTLPLILRRGEIIGLAGLAGSGRSSILRQVYGMQRRPDLSINFEGQPRTIGSPGQAMRLGIAYVGEDRATQGIFANLPLRETVMTPVRVLDGEILVGGEDHAVEEVIERLEIRGDPEEPMESLSGGNQQKALFGRWILVKPKLFLLDEPTRGIDVRAKAQIHHLIRDLADKGASVLVVSSELPELLSLADRIAVIKDGQVTDILEGAELSEDDVLEAMSTISPIAEAV